MDQTQTTRRIAAVDLGSNTSRLLVADVTRREDGSFELEPVYRTSTITKLAEGVDTRGILLPAPITRVRNALIDYRQLARKHEAVFVYACATSAVRDADNGEAFLGEIEHGFGFKADVLDGSQEAFTTWRGVTSDTAMRAATQTGFSLLVDIGGGSTELVLTVDGQLYDHHSFQLGSVRVTERFFAEPNQPLPMEVIDLAGEAIRFELEERFPAAEMDESVDRKTIACAIGVAGTVTTVSAICQGMEVYDPTMIHASTISVDDIEAVIHRLAELPLEARAATPGLEPARAGVIVGGLLILREICAHFRLRSIIVSERDILDGIALLAGEIAFRDNIDELIEPFGNTVC